MTNERSESLEQKKLEAIREIIEDEFKNDLGPCPRNYSFHVCQKILSAISQFDEPKTEPLEVEIEYMMETFYLVYHSNLASYHGKVYLRFFSKKQEAIDFCKRHGLRIKNDPQTKEG